MIVDMLGDQRKSNRVIGTPKIYIQSYFNSTNSHVLGKKSLIERPVRVYEFSNNLLHHAFLVILEMSTLKYCQKMLQLYQFNC